ncbi:carbohydrate ABC transporter permease [Intrasporangium calvum]|uniref:Carbohydrate ABC transporter membrane protein 1, CUT1 family n=1 Tax=Intrasporangium calvum (strain ATCC 23552 / DSM 43043 / JCM 3097 / NBRC 12989 / NCIMB 10167 / NRRL B-3866 / 7 KIP) TaxID=710696 RepID=E6S860_INTC7|nr:sugar ABC transporter permease [Intrasporangium calvum]ADU46964.1 carbohydrate ABC transporter membrane protein 1, CUT1 family [Intrasporangium calvum DSM 43043]
MSPAPGRARRQVGPPGEPRRIGYLFVLPAFAVYAAFALYPLLKAVYLSLWNWDGLTLATWAGLSNYADVLGDDRLRGAFGHALVLMVFFAVLPLLVGLVLAAVLHRSQVRGLGFFRTVVFLPQVVAMVVIAVAWRRIYAPGGSLNSLLGAVGLESWTRGWLGDYTFALPAVGVVGTWLESGLVTVLLLAGMSRIPKELYEAARLDGAGPIREFLGVTLPSIRAEIAVALTLTVIAALKTFDLIYLTTAGGPGHSTTVPSYEVYRQAFEIGQVGLASTIGVILTVIIFAISFVITRIGDRVTD